MTMNSYDIIFLSQTDNAVTLYANCYKRGYRRLAYFRDPASVMTVLLEQPELTVEGLEPGLYTFYGTDDEGNETGYVQVRIEDMLLAEYLDSLLAYHNMDTTPYTDLVHAFTGDDPVLALYRAYKTAAGHRTEYEELLTVFTDERNVRQEQLNLFLRPLFTFDKADGTIVSSYKLPYTFYVYRYDLDDETWILDKDDTQYRTNEFRLAGKPSEMYRILVLSDFQVVREYYLYEPSGTLSETILERRIAACRLAAEKTVELRSDEDAADGTADQYKLAAALLDFDTDRPVLQRPVVETDEDGLQITVTVPDYDPILFGVQPIYLAALEVSEIFWNSRPHKIPVTADRFTIRRARFLTNADTEYVFYFIDQTGKPLSQVTLVSFDDAYPVETYADYYRKIQLERYRRKLYAVFQQYAAGDWNIVSSILDLYFLSIEKDVPFSVSVIRQLTYLNDARYRIDVLIQLVLLCELRHYMPVRPDFIRRQVYSQMFRVHVMPASDTDYLIHIVHINGDTVTHEYRLSDKSGATEIRMDRDDFLWVQAIDPATWKLSGIAFYNNRVKQGRGAFYFPQLEVEVI